MWTNISRSKWFSYGGFIGLIYIYVTPEIKAMRRAAILLFTFAIIFACNNNHEKNTRNNRDEKAIRDETDDNKDKDERRKNDDNDKNSNGPYRWTEKERNKFVNDCKRESAENVAKNKLDDFCSCMLSQAQKYYPNYKQMDENSNEDSDTKILDECLGKYIDEDTED